MRNGSQMGTEPTSSREQVDIAKTVYTLKIRGGCEVDSYGKRAGKGALINENMAMTLGVSQDQTLFVPKFVNSSGGGIAGTLDANYYKGCGVREGIEREFIAVKKNELPESI